MISKEKGDIGEAMVLADLVAHNVQVLQPFGDHARYDLVIDINGKFLKLQIKYCDQKTKNNSIICPCVSSTNHTTNKHYSSYKDDVDYMCFYIVEWNKIAYVPIQEIGNLKSFTIRNQLPKNNQANIHLIDNYSFEKTLCVETLHDESKA